jgi:NADH dehydrogenase
MQEGQYVARLIQKQLKGETMPAFRYADYGNLAVIGRNAAVVDLRFMKFAGFPAWLAWIFIHIFYLIEFDNKLLVLIQWGWNYFTRKRGARLITNQEASSPMGVEESSDYRTPVKV